MAYSRPRRRRVRRRRNPIRRRRVTRSRRVRTRRPMTRKRVLNITTTKKNDAMQQITWVTNDATGTNPPAAPSLQLVSLNLDPIASGGDKLTDGWVILAPFIPSARIRPQYGSNPTLVSDSSTRENPETFAVGYAETVRITQYRGVPWMWRRIVFMAKGVDLLVSSFVNAAANPHYYYYSQDYGYTRITSRADPTVQSVVANRIFDGQQGKDWRNPMDAKIDTNRVRLISDRTMTMNPANGDGRISTRKFFYPIRKNLVYNDQEQGFGEGESHFSSTAANSCGDMYIIDFFTSGAVNSGVTDAYLDFAVEGKYYWHER
ncbi:capsid protein [Plant associated genomovirus 1]|uniref:Capsid protein n=1 Tax=Plant associated genomovirus 1 TaxID=2584380 RepID=A0A4Y5QC97_9VIRU|nr:capsid protein [Plant associated genomovirus 1]QCX29338.1 capsid protein [Plant associated genomovirus 1]